MPEPFVLLAPAFMLGTYSTLYGAACFISRARTRNRTGKVKEVIRLGRALRLEIEKRIASNPLLQDLEKEFRDDLYRINLRDLKREVEVSVIVWRQSNGELTISYGRKGEKRVLRFKNSNRETLGLIAGIIVGQHRLIKNS